MRRLWWSVMRRPVVRTDDHTPYDVVTGERPDVELSDRDLVERATRTANGDKFAWLWRGDTSDYLRHSEAAQALCTRLAFWTGGDAERIERMFGRSGLVCEKWRERPDYRERTIRKGSRRVRSTMTLQRPDSSEEDAVAAYVADHRELLTRVLAHGDEETPGYALALLANGGTVQDIGAVQRELEQIKLEWTINVLVEFYPSRRPVTRLSTSLGEGWHPAI